MSVIDGSLFLQLGVAGGAMALLYMVLKPLIGAHIRALEKFGGTQDRLGDALVTMQRSQNEMLQIMVVSRDDLQRHFAEEAGIHGRLLSRVEEIHGATVAKGGGKT